MKDHFLKTLLLVCVFQFLGGASAAGTEAWRSRSIYQILTDRFAKSDKFADQTKCTDLGKYCGGTWKGIEQNLDYIQGMGFDAIWISPVQKNSKEGYHGYWATDFKGLNEHFGEERDLVSMIGAAHERGMYVMIDVVANHVGYLDGATDFSGMSPFSEDEHYHEDCEIEDWGSQWQRENCRLAGLPDLA